MPQSSLMTWLGKSTSVKQPSPLPEVAQKQEKHESLQRHESPTPRPLEPTQNPNSNPTQTKQLPPFLKPKPPLPSNVHLRAPTQADIPSFKQLNTLLLPIPYPGSFYREILSSPIDHNITLLALWHDDPTQKETSKGRLVGAIRCRLFGQPAPTTSAIPKEGPMLYLSTLVLLSPYRGHGIAAHMLDVLTRRAVEDYGIGSVGAHVWEANEEGLKWYRKRGFKEVRKDEGYYRKLKPQGAVVMRKEIGVMDLAG